MSMVREGVQFIHEIYERRGQIYDLTRRDFMNRYIGSMLGLLWAFLEPLAMMLIMWGVFSFGLKVRPSGNVPFIAYLFTGMSAYNFFSESAGASSNVIRTYDFLVKKVKFRIAILPIVKILSALIIHIIFLFIVMAVIWISGIKPDIYWLQSLYYLIAMLAMLLGLGWLLSAIGVFIRDIANVIGILLTFGFWLTPIFWNKDMLPAAYQKYLCLNPMFYIVQGYRDSFLYHIPFWQHPINTAYYWAFTTILLLAGIVTFKKLRPHFADVL